MVSEDLITVDDEKNIIDLTFTPTIPHCSMATLIGLTIHVKLIRSLPSRFKVSVKITEGSHSQVFIHTLAIHFRISMGSRDELTFRSIK